MPFSIVKPRRSACAGPARRMAAAVAATAAFGATNALRHTNTHNLFRQSSAFRHHDVRASRPRTTHSSSSFPRARDRSRSIAGSIVDDGRFDRVSPSLRFDVSPTDATHDGIKNGHTQSTRLASARRVVWVDRSIDRSHHRGRCGSRYGYRAGGWSGGRTSWRPPSSRRARRRRRWSFARRLER